MEVLIPFIAFCALVYVLLPDEWPWEEQARRQERSWEKEDKEDK